MRQGIQGKKVGRGHSQEKLGNCWVEEPVGGLGDAVRPRHQKPHHTEGVPHRTPRWLGTTTPPMGSRKEGRRLHRGPSDTARAGQRPAAGGLGPSKLLDERRVRQKRPPLPCPMAFGERSECKGSLWVSQGDSRTQGAVVSHRPVRAAPGGLSLPPPRAGNISGLSGHLLGHNRVP